MYQEGDAVYWAEFDFTISLNGGSENLVHIFTGVIAGKETPMGYYTCRPTPGGTDRNIHFLAISKDYSTVAAYVAKRLEKSKTHMLKVINKEIARFIKK